MKRRTFLGLFPLPFIGKVEIVSPSPEKPSIFSTDAITYLGDVVVINYDSLIIQPSYVELENELEKRQAVHRLYWRTRHSGKRIITFSTKEHLPAIVLWTSNAIVRVQGSKGRIVKNRSRYWTEGSIVDLKDLTVDLVGPLNETVV